MGKGSAKQEITDYYMSLHFGICTEVDALTGIYVNEKTAWEGDVATQSQFDISKRDLFGGRKKEGGLHGAVTFLPGTSSQVLPEHLANKFGLSAATAPGFRGFASVFFHSRNTSGQSTGFLWSSNNPIIAQTIWTRVRRSPKGLDPLKAMIGADGNPVHMIYECLINTDWGMGSPLGGINLASFTEAANTIFDEGFGMSLIWTRQTKVEEFVSEVLDHIEAALFTDPRTGQLTIKLIRNDYDAETLREMTPDNASLENFQRKFPGETINEIIVTWTNPANEQDETVTVQNIAAIERQGGEIVSDGRNYYGVRNATLATTLAVRDLRAASSPLSSAKVQLLREFWDIVPADVVRLVWLSENGSPPINSIMRVVGVDYGKIGSPYILVDMIEDVFALTQPISALPPSTAWVSESENPAAVATAQVFTLPYYFAAGTTLGNRTPSLEFPEVVAGMLAYQTGTDTRSYELLAQVVDTSGATVFENIGTHSLLGRTTLATALVAEATSTFPSSNVPDPARGPEVNGFLIIGATEATQEIALVTGTSGSNFLLNRGVLDTLPQAWPIGTPVWFLSTDLDVADEQVLRAVGETAVYKLLPNTSLGTLAEASAPTVTGTLTGRPYRPLRPANVKINTVAFGDVAIGASPTITITWAIRNRLVEEGVVLAYTDGAVAPEYAQRTIVRVYDDATNTLLVTYDHLWTENTLVLQKTWFDRYAAIRIEVLSEREGRESFQRTIRTVTGFANSGAAAVPPAPPISGEPALQGTAPGASAFTATGTTINEGGFANPAITVAGTPDDAKAVSLLIRYRKNGTSTWLLAPQVALRPTVAVQTQITSVGSATIYNIEVAYGYLDSPQSPWRALANVTTGGTSLTLPTIVGVAGTYTNANLTIGADGRVLVASNGSGGAVTLYDREQVVILPTANAASVTIIGAAASAVGLGARAISNTNAFTRRRRVALATAATANSFVNIRETTAGLWLTNGFDFRCRWGVESIAADGRIVVGLFNTWAATNDPSNATNCVFVGKDSADSTLSVFHNSATGLCTKIALGAAFPATSAVTDIYEVKFISSAGSSRIDYTVTNLTTSAVATGSITTDMPAATSILNSGIWAATGATATACVLNFFGYYRSSTADF